MPKTKVYVQYSDGSPASGVPVRLCFEGIFGGITDSFYTNQDGVAIVDHMSTGMAEVYVNGDEKERIRAPGTTVVTL